MPGILLTLEAVKAQNFPEWSETERILLTEVYIQQNIVHGAYIFQDRCDRGQQPTNSANKKISKSHSGMGNPNGLVQEKERERGGGIEERRKARHK